MGKTRGHGNRGASQKGSRQVHVPPHKRNPGKGPGEYNLAGGVPWPELGDGTSYLPGLRVRHRDFPDWVGKVQWTEFRGPDGEHLKERTKPATKTRQEAAIEGAEWYAVVSWDNPDEPDRPLTRLPMTALEAE